MAMLYVKTPNGNTKSINLETMNVNDIWQDGYGYSYTVFPSGLILQSKIWNSGSWPIKFPNRCIGVLSQVAERGNGYDVTIHTISGTTHANDTAPVIGTLLRVKSSGNWIYYDYGTTHYNDPIFILGYGY